MKTKSVGKPKDLSFVKNNTNMASPNMHFKLHSEGWEMCSKDSNSDSHSDCQNVTSVDLLLKADRLRLQQQESTATLPNESESQSESQSEDLVDYDNDNHGLRIKVSNIGS